MSGAQTDGVSASTAAPMATSSGLQRHFVPLSAALSSPLPLTSGRFPLALVGTSVGGVMPLLEVLLAMNLWQQRTHGCQLLQVFLYGWIHFLKQMMSIQPAMVRCNLQATLVFLEALEFGIECCCSIHRAMHFMMPVFCARTGVHQRLSRHLVRIAGLPKHLLKLLPGAILVVQGGTVAPHALSAASRCMATGGVCSAPCARTSPQGRRA
eukprot:CAMPEP_0168453080 /NCGR_PEP_ID=MMETSP0228-20121227/49498_1 /TAXON_ID=133427 /ORGANISM="Protoceratium reticulatum, Strain CCCM 535 (=CCMP 1889)" /LENGTH=209 /DNA_ID=CAMNT_0008467779 /DNA_START=8 /DNA_END=632 /DNA_ORIENTATION=+